MAGITTRTRLVEFLRRFPRLFSILRQVARIVVKTPSGIARRMFCSSQRYGAARGFYSGSEMVRNGTARGEIILESQLCKAFSSDSLVKISGLGQDAHQPWPVFWTEIPDAHLCGRSLVPRDQHGRLLAEATFSQIGDLSDPAYNYVAFGTRRFIQGNATSIVSRWGGDARGNRRYGGAGYWHWLFDSVARLSLMERFPSDTMVITPPLAPWMRWFLDQLTLGQRVIETESEALHVERFYFSAPSSMTGCWNPYAVDFLRRSFLPKASAPSASLPKRFYILREGYTRGIANEAEVRDYFQSIGWALIAPEKLPIPDQIALFRDAEAIAGLHGSALTNLVWCSSKTKIIEFITSDLMSGAFEWLSALNGLDHRFLICPGDRNLLSLVSLQDMRALIPNI